MKILVSLILGVMFVATASLSQAEILLVNPGGSYSPLTSISVANTSVQVAGKTVIITSPYTISTDTVLRGDCTWKFVKGGLLTIASGKTLTFQNQPQIPDGVQAFAGTGAVAGLTVARPEWWGATDGADSTTAVQAALLSAPLVTIPKGVTYFVKNLTPTAGQTVRIDGTLKLPAASASGDAIFTATGVNGVRIIGTGIIDGNKGAQSGSAYQRLISLTSCNAVLVGGGLTLQSNYSGTTDDIGAIEITGSNNKVDNIFLYDWSKEGVYFKETSYSSVSNVIAIDSDGDSWSAVQVSGTTSTYNQISNITAKNTGASAVGCDSTYSTVSNLVIDTVRYNNGLNLGHTGKPASYSTVNNVTVANLSDGVNANSAGLNIGGASTGVVVSNLIVNGSTQRGVNISDGATDIDLTNIKLANCVTALALYQAGNVRVHNLNLYGTITTGISKDNGASSMYTTLHLNDVDLTAATTRISGASGGMVAPFMQLQTAIFDNTAGMEGSANIAGLGAGGTITITNANARANSRILLQPSNSAGMSAQPFISTQNDNSFVITTVNSGAGGAYVRWKII